MRRAALAAASAALAFPAAAAAHGDQVPRDELAGAWAADWLVLAGAAVGAALFVQAALRLRRRGRSDLAGASRAVLFGAGSATVVLALVSPLDAVGEEYLLSGHMLQHTLLGDLGPALLVTAVRGPLVFFLLPPVVLAPLARVRPLRSVLAFLVRLPAALALWAAAYAAWHVPAAYDAALGRPVVHGLEHASFLLTGLLVWNAIVDPARRAERSRGARIAVAVCLFAAGQVLADVLIFSFAPLYGPYAVQDERLFGLSALTDQQLAGVVMMVEQLLTLGTATVLLLLPAVCRRRLRAPRFAS